MPDDQQNQDQQYALMAAAAAAAYARKRARDEARRAMIISTAQNMSNLDPQTQQELRKLRAAETRRVRQENFDWKAGWIIAAVIVGLVVLFWLLMLAH